MTRAFKCKECGAIVDFDSYPPSMREIYLTLENAGRCEICGGDLKIDKDAPFYFIEKHQVPPPLHSTPTPTESTATETENL